MAGLPFEVPTCFLAHEELVPIARAVGELPELWREALGRCHGERRHVDVFTNVYLGVWAVSWTEDTHDTGFHDHDGSHGGVYVVEGTVRHEQLRLDQPPVGEPVTAGEAFEFDPAFIHRVRREPGTGPAVTIHAYSPPLTSTGQYGDDDRGVLHRWTAGPDEHLKPRDCRRTGAAEDPSLN